MPTLIKKNDKSIESMKIEFVKLYAPTTSWGNIVSMNLGYHWVEGCCHEQS